MIDIVITKCSKQYRELSSHGHAGYGEEGTDIICAAVSALMINTVNSIETFTEDEFDVKVEDGLLELNFTQNISLETGLLMDSLVLGIQNIINDNDEQYIQLEIKEV